MAHKSRSSGLVRELSLTQSPRRARDVVMMLMEIGNFDFIDAISSMRFLLYSTLSHLLGIYQYEVLLHISVQFKIALLVL